MSILIKGMEMPKDRGVYIAIDIDGQVYAKPLGALEWQRLDQKAVPVPEHGDLIDRREAIIDANERAYDFWLSDDEVNATIQFLKEQPTILPADSAEEGEA